VADHQKPLPALTSLNRPFFEAAKRGELALQRCDRCGQRWFPPAGNCPNCLCTQFTWAPVSGRGRLWSWIVMHQKYFAAFEADLPYNVAFIALDEGPFLMSSVIDADPAQFRCDAPVEVVFEQATDEIAIPKFRLLP
jgi:uncharacterized OB-fold protein